MLFQVGKKRLPLQHVKCQRDVTIRKKNIKGKLCGVCPVPWRSSGWGGVVCVDALAPCFTKKVTPFLKTVQIKFTFSSRPFYSKYEKPHVHFGTALGQRSRSFGVFGYKTRGKDLY